MGRRGRRRGKGKPKGIMGKISSFFHAAARRPLTRVIAPALVLTGLLQLLATPLPNGDGFFGRLTAAFNSGGKNIFASDNPTNGSGNNMFSILALQIQQNLPNAIPAFGGAFIAALIGRATKT